VSQVHEFRNNPLGVPEPTLSSVSELMSVRFLDLNKQYLTMKSEIDAALTSVIEQSAFIGGPFVSRFETAFAAYQQAKFCVGCGNGTDAIEIALSALGLPKGSEVIVPANTFIATAEAVTRAGLKVVFCDCDPHNYTISIPSFAQAITANTSAVIPVHIYGQPCEMQSVLQIANDHGLKVVEDCAQAHGAEINGQRVGTFGTLGAFSFYPGKNLGAFGDAGAIVTNDEGLALSARKIANHGRIDKYNHEIEGRNSRLDGIQAAILSVKLQRLDDWIARRIEIADTYYEALSELDELILPVRRKNERHVFHLYVIRTDRRNELREFLNTQQIETGIHYPIALPKLQAYAYCGQAGGEFCANIHDSKLLSLPIGEHMCVADAMDVANKCREFFLATRS
jgi:dTDP-4-amino-4,6-dideoxygalactose transaminase